MTTGRYVALDFETSGYAAHSACAVGLCRIEDGVVTDSFYSLIRPPSSRVLFTHVHGLTWPMLKDAPTFTELWPQLVAFMEGSHALLAHNAGFDRRVLHASCQALELVQPQLPFLGQLHLTVGDCCDLPYEDDMFATVTSINTVYFWPDTVKGLSEIRRTLKKGSSFYNIVFTKAYLNTIKYTQTGYKKFEPEELVEYGKQAGFEHIEIKEIVRGKSYVVIYTK